MTKRTQERPAKESSTQEKGKKRASVAFGWLAGGSLGILINYGLFLLVGVGYPTVPTTFVLFVCGAFGGMALADRLGVGAFKVLGLAAGILLAAVLALVLAVLASGS